MKIALNSKMAEAIEIAVLHAISVVGIVGLKKTSMFPSSEKRLTEYKMAA